MQRLTQDPWSVRSSGRLSPSTSGTASEAYYSGDADDELTVSEDTSSVVTSDMASGSEGGRPRSPTPSDGASIYSYSSSTHHLTRESYGRTVNNVNDVSHNIFSGQLRLMLSDKFKYYLLPGICSLSGCLSQANRWTWDAWNVQWTLPNMAGSISNMIC